MSLTSLIKQKEVYDQFYNTFSEYNPELDSQVYKAPLTTNYALVGTAFDYLLRFHVSKLNGVVDTNWVAKYGYRTKKDRVINALEEAELDYLDDNKENWALHALKLARIERYYRSGGLDLSPLSRKDIHDLDQLIDAVPFALFKGDYIGNPTFNDGSVMLGGADADLIIDDLLIDIKTTKYLRFTNEMYYQLIGYQLLTNEYGITDYPNAKIKRLAIYFSRYGLLHILPHTFTDVKFTDIVGRLVNGKR